MKAYDRHYLKFNDPISEYLISLGAELIEENPKVLKRFKLLTKSFGNIEIILPRRHYYYYIVIIKVEKNVENLDFKATIKDNRYNFIDRTRFYYEAIPRFIEHFSQLLQ